MVRAGPLPAEARVPDQILLCDFMGRMRSRLMVARAEPAGGTRPHFGSVVVPVRSSKTGKTSFGPVHGRHLRFHKIYSRQLLGPAAHRLARR